MDAKDRKELGETIAARRRAIFGTKMAAYTEAKVNAATWDRAEAGEPIREDRMTAIIKTLWPHSEGDSTRISGMPQDWPEWPDRSERTVTWESLSTAERDDRILVWVADNFVRINERLADLEAAISNRRESSDPPVRLAPAALDVDPDVDQEAGESTEG